MKYRHSTLCLFAMLAACLLFLQASNPTQTSSDELRPAGAFASIQNKAERSAAIFREAGKVLLHPRCINCHPSGDRPLQGDDSRPHMPWVQRGLGGLGVAGMRCAGCHHPENFEPAGIPGHSPWRLAPARMAWQGKTLSEVCAQIKDPQRNGGRTIKQIVEHMSEDGLVGWAWHPGPNLTSPPGSQQRLGELFQAWAKTGAVCP